MYDPISKKIMTLLNGELSESTAMEIIQHIPELPQDKKRENGIVLDNVFSNEAFVKHLPIDDAKLLESVLNENLEARREFTKNPGAPLELLGQFTNDPDFMVKVNLQEQIKVRPDLQSLKIAYPQLTDAEMLNSIQAMFHEVSQKVGINLSVDILNDESLSIDKEYFYVYLTESDPVQDLDGTVYAERTFSLTQSYVSSSYNRDEPDTADEHDLGVYKGIGQLVTETLAHHTRVNVESYLEAKAEDEMVKQMHEEEQMFADADTYGPSAG